MKKFVLLAAACAVAAACSQTAEEPAPPAETTAAEPATATATADQGVAPGTYDVKMADGSVATTAINADGSYVDTGPEGEQVRGAYARKDGKDCFDPAGDDPEMCWTVGETAADGSFTATSADGETTVTVTPQAAAEPIAAE